MELSSERDVREVFASFVEGKIGRLPWCVRLNTETNELQPNLVHMNRNGLLTINSQVNIPDVSPLALRAGHW